MIVSDHGRGPFVSTRHTNSTNNMIHLFLRIFIATLHFVIGAIIGSTIVFLALLFLREYAAYVAIVLSALGIMGYVRAEE